MKAANDILNMGGMLNIAGQTAQFDVNCPDDPDFTLRAFYNGLAIMDRACLLEGGEGCDAWKSDQPSGQRCDWRVQPIPEAKVNAEYSDSTMIVWETLALHNGQLTLTIYQSGDTAAKTLTYTCDDPRKLVQYMKGQEQPN